MPVMFARRDLSIASTCRTHLPWNPCKFSARGIAWVLQHIITPSIEIVRCGI